MKYKHGLLLFLSSLVPGCGQMHQGYMKRGISILTAFCGVFALAIFLEIGALAVLMIPLWLYSFFDSYNLRGRLMAEAAPEDTYLFGLSDMDSEKLGILLKKRHSVVGWVLVGVGVYALWQMVADWLSDFFLYLFGPDDGWWLDYAFSYAVPRTVVTLFIIALGIWFIRGPKAVPTESIPAFTPPAGPEEAAAPEEGAAPEEPEAPEEEDAHGEQ